MSESTRQTTDDPVMGAILGSKGVTFRVWAPHAEKVHVTGTFNGWSETSTPLFSEKNGTWSAEVSEAKAGDEYRYLILGPTGPLSRIDPYARKVTNSTGNGIIYDPKAFDWGGLTTFKWPRGMSLSFTRCTSARLTLKKRGIRARLPALWKSFPIFKNWVSMPWK